MTGPALRCSHCELPVDPAAALVETSGAETAAFCCPGCRRIHRLLRDEGLDGFYRTRRGWTPGPPEDSAFDPADFAASIREVPGGLREATIGVAGIRCSSCAWLIERRLRGAPGVARAHVSFATARAQVRWDPTRTGFAEIALRMREIGYTPLPYEEAALDAALAAERRDLLIRFGTAAFLSMQVMTFTAGLYAGHFQGMDPAYRRIFDGLAVALTTPIVFYAGFPFLRGAVAGFRNRAPGMDALVFLGAFCAWAESVAALATGWEIYADTAAMVITLVLLGRYLEAVAKGRARDAIARLVRLAPPRARRVRAGLPTPEIVPAASLAPGDVVEIAPGDRIPADGRVTSGLSDADESTLTGESRAVPKGPGDQVFAGTINGTGRLFAEVTGTGADTALARIVRAVEEAQAAKAPIQRLADRVVARFVPAVLAIAAVSLAVRLLSGAPVPDALLASISVLVVACPCALGLATPLAVYLGTIRAREMGIMVRGGDVLEAAAKATRVFLDKTGTVTEGRPGVSDVVGFGLAREDVLRIAAALEAPSEHALGKAIVRANAAGVAATAEEWTSRPGSGVEGVVEGRRYRLGTPGFAAAAGASIGAPAREAFRALSGSGKTAVLLADDTRAVGILALRDAVRPESAEAVAMIRGAGLGVTLVTGDSGEAADAVATRIGVGDRIARATPAEKAAAARAARDRGETVIMVGDGVNDAPALAEAGVGVAMGRGTGVALECAGAVLLAEDLRLVPRFAALSRRTMAVARRNLWWAFSYNAVAIPLAAAGRLHPVVSAALMAASSLLVVASSMRLGRWRG